MFFEDVKYVSFAVGVRCKSTCVVIWQSGFILLHPPLKIMSLLDPVRFSKLHREHLERKAQGDSLHV